MRYKNVQRNRKLCFHEAVLRGHGRAKQFIRDERFEIFTATDFLSRQGYSDKKTTVFGDAIALNTMPDVPQHKQPEIALGQHCGSTDELLRLQMRGFTQQEAKNSKPSSSAIQPSKRPLWLVTTMV
ncbi:hypothetical protein HNQ59_003876 [Chitinivorax tropicus]|uniref:Uncharacterized protein n=1 Tax=Chitinivorax tropicus TaxID=714531 RepID=A0A840MT22_9PROT|nr:hypothetical protein [Chitinivorax tropicus]MBB5020555.1 hypothetical protein [Chitinivorax tropicus]